MEMNKKQILSDMVILAIVIILAIAVTCVRNEINEKIEEYKAQATAIQEELEKQRSEVETAEYKKSENKHEEPIIIPNENTVDPEDMELLAIAICQEGGGDSVCDECRYRIGDVVLNRVNDPRFPDTLQEVLEQEGQYGRFHWTGVKWPDRASNAEEQNAVERAKETSYNLLADIRHSELYGNGYIWQAEFKQGTDIVECCGIYYGR